MPSTYAHRRFGADVLVQLPRELREKITPYRPLYDMGLHGPDLMFYYRALQSNPVNRLGNAMHEQPGRVFFTRARGVVNTARARVKNTRPGCSCMALPSRFTGLDCNAR